MYDYVGHLKKFGFEWNHNALGFKFEIKIDNSDSKKIKKKILSRNTRKNISTDQSRIWNMVENWQFNNSANDNSKISFLIGYLHDEKKVKDFFNMTNSFDFTTLMTLRKNLFLMD